MERHAIPLMNRILWGLAVLAGIAIVSSSLFWSYASPERTCNSCHEINAAHELWAGSAHREASCAACHGTALGNGFHSLWENSRRLVSHFSGPAPDTLRLNQAQVAEMVLRCKKCHEHEYADWLSSGHSMRFADVFLNPRHNRDEQPNDDCLRCHAMFSESGIAELVAPLSTQGPWTLLQPGSADQPAIPCLACHEIHFRGRPAARPDYSDPAQIAARRAPDTLRPAFYDRREKRHFDISLLPLPAMRDAQRTIKTSPDERQRLCYQCHAPAAERQVGSADDRTPKGVHEGLSCLACHDPHSQDARSSCAECHPRLSNCGRDVDKMDTTFFSPASRHNIHFVACADCHPRGVPPKRPEVVGATGR
jgi:hypothetical protein